MLSANSQEGSAHRYFSIAFLVDFIFGIASWIASFLFLGVFIVHPAPPGSVPYFSVQPLIFPMVISAMGMVIFVYYLWHGFTLIEKIVENASLGKIGSILSIFSIFIYPVIIYLISLQTSPPGTLEPFIIVSSIAGAVGVIGLVGWILVVVALFRIGDFYGSTIIKVGAILFLFLSFIGAIILFVGFKDLESKPTRNSVILPPPPPW